jgi:hypothetical protein
MITHKVSGAGTECTKSTLALPIGGAHADRTNSKDPRRRWLLKGARASCTSCPRRSPSQAGETRETRTLPFFRATTVQKNDVRQSDSTAAAEAKHPFGMVRKSANAGRSE